MIVDKLTTASIRVFFFLLGVNQGRVGVKMQIVKKIRVSKWKEGTVRA